MIRSCLLAAAMLTIAACSEPAEDSAPSLDEVIAQVSDGVPSTRKVDRLTKESDPQELQGQRDGYEHGIVFYDSRLTCAESGIECGAFLEAWDDADEAKRRSAYLKALQQGMPEPDVEHHFIKGRFLLRVHGGLAKRDVEQYDAALDR